MKIKKSIIALALTVLAVPAYAADTAKPATSMKEPQRVMLMVTIGELSPDKDTEDGASYLYNSHKVITNTMVKDTTEPAPYGFKTFANIAKSSDTLLRTLRETKRFRRESGSSMYAAVGKNVTYVSDGEKSFYATREQDGEKGSLVTIHLAGIGLQLDITPRVEANGKISLAISQSKSDAPSTLKITRTVYVPSGGTAVLGGFFKGKKELLVMIEPKLMESN